MRITKEQLLTAIPAARKAPINTYLPFIQAAMDEFEINTKLRVAAFLAQVAHETLDFQFLRELWDGKGAQAAYEPPSEKAAELGNTHPGDGKRFRGRGGIQLTGRGNYKKYGNILKLPLEVNPDLALTPEVAFRVAGVFWQDHDLNTLADEKRFQLITRRINGGTNGLEERQARYEALLRALA
jgi:putative chitinase